jgi:DNA invertase Pin-like site-specific DNA recombinase
MMDSSKVTLGVPPTAGRNHLLGFRFLAEPRLDTTSAHGKLIFDMFASLAEYKRSRLSERTKAG